GLGRGCRRKRPPVGVVDHLGVDVARRAEHGQTRPLRRAPDLLADPAVAPDPRFALAVRHRVGLVPLRRYFADFPALRCTRSSAYRMPLPLYGSGGPALLPSPPPPPPRRFSA